MKTRHASVLRAFERRLAFLLMFRGALRWTALWFFIWGVVILALRFTGAVSLDTLLLGLLGFFPLAGLAAWLEWRRRPDARTMRAAYDRTNGCGGLIMAEELHDTASWQSSLPAPALPPLRWRSSRTVNLFGAAALFVALTLLLPDRFTTLASHRPLEIGQLVGELESEIEVLEEEKILEENKAAELKDQLQRLQDEASGTDPSKTWEALDHIKDQNSQSARQAGEEALAKMTSLTQSEALATALQMAMMDGLGQDVATQAAQDLASLLQTAKLEEGLLQGEIPKELLQAAQNGLTSEQLEKILRSIEFNKDRLGKTAGKLAQLKMIDADLLAKCQGAGECPNVAGLAAFLKECEGTGECDALAAVLSYCRGGVTRGRGDAPMTWADPSSEEGVTFKEEVLPPSSSLSDSRFIGVSRSAPKASPDGLATEHGALAGAAAGAGSVHAQTILPRHKKVVQQYFKRED